MHTDSAMATRSCPETSEAFFITLRALSVMRRIFWAYSKKRSPCGVSVTVFPTRSNRQVSSSASSWLICIDMADCE